MVRPEWVYSRAVQADLNWSGWNRTKCISCNKLVSLYHTSSTNYTNVGQVENLIVSYGPVPDARVLEYIGNCSSPSHPDMEQLQLLYWIQ